ncbi:hypothetical protein [Streptomyces lutosisoli]|uniref:hypothetical protein n=1 Tax=Streptomyces lutosisoli TaxID=2665721 RepID=UPI00360793CD
MPNKTTTPTGGAARAGLGLRYAELRGSGAFRCRGRCPGFGSVLAEVFTETAAHVVDFDNPLQGGTAANTVYIARRRDG